MKTALVHDWLFTIAGAESVLAEMCRLYPEAPIYTLFHGSLQNTPFVDKTIISSPLQNIPFIEKIYRKIPNLFPWAISKMDTKGFDLVLSSSHAAAKAIPTDEKTCHISYVHTPMRYIWDLSPQYLESLPFFLRPYALHVFKNLRCWDVKTANNVDFFIANSHYIKKRIAAVYKRDAEVIYPPVHLAEKYETNKQNVYVTASRHVAYKKIPLIAHAFASMPDKKLLILGDGPDYSKVQAIAAKSSNIQCLGYLPRKEMLEQIGKAKAFIFAAEEDFGILPVEAQSLGTPVIAFNKGGAAETVIDGKTGLFFSKQSISSICEAVKRFERIEDNFDPSVIAAHAAQFSSTRFQEELSHTIQKKIKLFKK